MSKEGMPTEEEFTGWRKILWPIHNFELKKFLPMGLMMLCILFIYTLVRDLKDTLMVSKAICGGAETLGFLKLYGVTPSAILFLFVFVKLANVLEREKLGSTGIGQGVAIPHGKTDVLSEQVGVLGISKKGIEFNSLDGEPVYIIFLLVGPVEVTGQHLKALSRISRLFKDKFLRQAIKDAETKEDVIKIIQQEDAY